MLKVTSDLLPWVPFVPLAGALALGALRMSEATRRAVFLGCNLVGLALTGVLVAQAFPGGEPAVQTAWEDYLFADGLTLIMLGCTFLLVAGVGLYSFAYMAHEKEEGRVTEAHLRFYYAVLCAFSAFMSWTVILNNFIFMFLAIEASSISSAYLVSFYKSRPALEAAFKYNLLVVTALIFALLGTIIIYAKMSVNVEGVPALHLSEIGRTVPELPPLMALTVAAFFLTAFGTKAGMIPFHAWLPDAHSEAPAPISALLSGLVISVGAYCLARTVTLFTPSFPELVVLVAAIASFSIVFGILMAIVQDDLKRLLAYSSISQVSYIFEGLGLGTYLGVYGGLFHAVTHLLAKSLLFFCAGAILYRMGIRKISELGGLGRKMPFTAFCFFIAAISMGGMPLMAGFMSKYSIILAVGQSRLWWAMGISAFAGLLTLACLVWAAWRVFWGEPSEKVAALPEPGVGRRRELPYPMAIPMGIAVGLILLLGVAPQILFPLLDSATQAIMGGYAPDTASHLATTVQTAAAASAPAVPAAGQALAAVTTSLDTLVAQLGGLR